jgi:spermidine synthase
MTFSTAPRRVKQAAFLLGAVAVAVAVVASAQQFVARTGNLEHDVVSGYSHIRIRKLGSTRTLLFVRDSGEEVVESMVDLEKPNKLLVEYTQYMFLSYAHRPEHKKVLIVGLGGGAMIHFLKHYDKNVEVHVVEIDPAIVKIADEYFRVRTEGQVKIITDDGIKYLANTTETYAWTLSSSPLPRRT